MLQSFLKEDYNQSLTRKAAPVSFASIIWAQPSDNSDNPWQWRYV